MFVPDKSPVKVYPEVLGFFFWWELHIVYMNMGPRFFSCSMNVLFIDLSSLAFNLHFFKKSFGFQIRWFTVSMKQWLDHCPWLVLQYRRQRLLW
jgi:hypothetical protein